MSTVKVQMSARALGKFAEKAARRVDFLSERARPLVEEMGRDMVRAMKANVRGGRLAPLSPEYRREKARAVGNAAMLERTGKMLASMYGAVQRRRRHWAVRLGFSGNHEAGLTNFGLAMVHRHGTQGSKTLVQSLRKQAAFFKGNRAEVDRVKAQISKAKSGIPPRDFTKLPRAWSRVWLEKIKVQLWGTK